MNSPDNIDITESLEAVENTFNLDQRRRDIAVVDGYGLRLRVDRGHLVLIDGLGPHRRERRYAKATHGLSRIVVLGSAGTLSLDALRWCDRLGIALVVVDLDLSRVSFTSELRGTDDARLRRVQALAPSSELGVDIARLLLTAKLEGQERLLRSTLEAHGPADSILALWEDIADASSYDELRMFEASAAACYFNAWSGSPLTVPRFIAKDRSRIPEHWDRFDGRRSVLLSNNGNRKAERPVNAILNYLFALVEVESILACHAVGMDPGLGITHLDARSRQSMALDLVEPVRPLVEKWTLDLLSQRAFKKSDFAESSDGQVRLLAPLTHELAGSMGQWRQAVAPWAEKVSHLLGDFIRGKYQPVTPLTGDNHMRAQREVKARKTKEAVYRDVFTREAPQPKQRVKGELKVPLRNCSTCGGQLLRGQHINCPTCWSLSSDQDVYTRNKRGEGISRAREEERKWREDHHSKGDPEVYRREILPGLKGVTLSQIMAACGVTKSTASTIRSGKRVPHERLWCTLQRIGQPSQEADPGDALPE